MGSKYATHTAANTTITTTSETVVATLGGVSSNRPGQTVRLEGEVTITTGGSTTAVTLRVRRDGVSGTLVGEGNPEQIEAAAGSSETHDLTVHDALTGELANATYVLTVQQTAAAADGTALQASLAAEMIP